VQLGLDPGSAIVLPGDPGLRDRLGALLTGRAARSTAGRDLLDDLADRDLLVDESTLMPLLGRRGRTSALPPTSAASLACTAGNAAGQAAASRARTRVHLTPFGHPAGEPLVDDLATLLGRAGLRTRRPRGDHVPGATPVLGVLVGVGEPDRELVDPWMREGTPFLCVRLTEGRAVVGPFVQPGSTACLRCIDAHHADADPSWPLLVRQYARASAGDRSDGVPEPVDPAQAAVALAWATRDLASYVDGLDPSTWSATLTVDPLLVQLRTRRWLRHPDCGCWWDAVSRGSA